MVDSRRQFTLPELDRDFLDRRALPWEAVVDGGLRWVLLHQHPVPGGYNVPVVSAALELPASYPDTQIDMVYFLPHLSLVSGRPVAQLSAYQLGGVSWQRWSRHRTGANPWRRDYDCLETHILLVDEWLERELRLAA